MSKTAPNSLLSTFNPQANFKPGLKSYWGKLYGSAIPLALSQLIKQKEHFVVVVTPDVPAAQQLSYELQFFLSNTDIEIFQFPDWEILPYDHFSPHQDIISERINTLHQLPKQKHGVLIVPVMSLLQKLSPVDYVNNNTLQLNTNMQIEVEQFRRDLDKKGYRYVNTVYEHGEFSVRGSIIDLFPMGSRTPYRIDLFDDEIESIKTFDVETQRSDASVNEINMMPAREFPTHKEAIELFREQYRDQIGGDLLSSIIYSDISEGRLPSGIEFYLPLFFNQTATLFDYLPANTVLCNYQGLQTNAEQFIEDVKLRYEQYRHNIQHPVLPPTSLYLQLNELFEKANKFSRIILQSFEFEEKAGVYNYHTLQPNPVKIEVDKAEPLSHLKQLIHNYSGKILFVTETAGRRENLLDLLKPHKIYPKVFDNFDAFIQGNKNLGITIGLLESGLLLSEPDLMLITESQLYGQQVMQRRRRQRTRKKDFDEDAIVSTLAELQVGAPVVHEDNGVGRYLGLETINIGDQEAEFLSLEYAGGDKLFVPVSSLHLISRYTGTNPDTAPLHKLGSGQWEKAKRKAKERIRDVAAELLEIYARREAQQGFVYDLDTMDYQRFCASFPFEETPDQAQAIEQVLGDMVGTKPMDRLVCGDVGFGKTEVAMRAAFIAAQSGKQIAILVPTTLLSQQHTENFQSRFAELPIKVSGISRFQSKKEQQVVIEGLTNGTVDIVIGTHKLLQKDIKFKNLGLIIIDEEHRFGVRQKEVFKALKSKVDVLAMTATPIPRTLNMSLAGIRDFSIIATPPARRIAIKTFVSEWNKETIREACQRELMRGGQIFFLHNNVSTIEKRARELEEIIPEAKIDIGHGQMPEHQLERVMTDFYHQRFNILVCTTIIETGIDIPTANTIIIERADRFGLAQLYQLRGRVGRSHHRAYAYLTVPPKNTMTAVAQKRLEAIESIEELGAGFTLASHDLEIRGAGELLGEDQSGQMQEIGFTLYTELLDRAVKSLKSGQEIDMDKSNNHGAEIELHTPALIPEDYLPDVHSRLIMYKRIANAKSDADLKDLQVEMIDRFGLLTEQIKNLFAVTSLKLIATKLGILEVNFSESGGRVVFEDTPPIDPMQIINLIQTKPNQYKLDGNNKIRLLKEIDDASQRIDYLKDLFKYLGSK